MGKNLAQYQSVLDFKPIKYEPADFDFVEEIGKVIDSLVIGSGVSQSQMVLQPMNWDQFTIECIRKIMSRCLYCGGNHETVQGQLFCLMMHK
jgi:hypothetical protein